MEPSIFWNLILATALGALIGTERAMPWAKNKNTTNVDPTGFG